MSLNRHLSGPQVHCSIFFPVSTLPSKRPKLMRLTSFWVIVATATFYTCGNVQATSTTTNLDKTSDTPLDTIHLRDGVQRDDKRFLRTAAQGVGNEERGWWGSTPLMKAAPGLENINQERAVANWLKNKDLYDDLLEASEEKLTRMFFTWHGLGWSDKTIKAAIKEVMSEAGKNPKHYKTIVTAYKDYRKRVAGTVIFPTN